jgi:hypothetical protein
MEAIHTADVDRDRLCGSASQPAESGPAPDAWRAEPASCETGEVTTQLAPEGRAMSTRTKVLISVGGAVMLFGMLVTAIFGFLLAPPNNILVVTMQQSATEADRAQLKADCGHLPAVKVVADQGNPDPHVQGRFPVRFDIGRATARQEAQLEACVNEHTRTVRGFLSEGDR